VLTDTRGLEDSFDVLEQVKIQGPPFAVAVDQFPDGDIFPELFTPMSCCGGQVRLGGRVRSGRGRA